MAVTLNTAILWDVKPHRRQKGTNTSDEHLAFTCYPVDIGSTFLQNTGTKHTALHSRRPFVTW